MSMPTWDTPPPPESAPAWVHVLRSKKTRSALLGTLISLILVLTNKIQAKDLPTYLTMLLVALQYAQEGLHEIKDSVRMGNGDGKRF